MEQSDSRNSIGTKLLELENMNSKSSASSTKPRRKSDSHRQSFVVCIENDGYEASLERKKIYEVLTDTDAAKHKRVRVIDESGEDYLYPISMFTKLTLPASLSRIVGERDGFSGRRLKP